MHDLKGDRRTRSDERLALRGLRVWDGLADGVSDTAMTILIEGRRILDILPDASDATHRAVEHAHQIALPGRFAIPGLIDAHVHLGLDPTIGSPDEQLKISDSARMIQMQERAEAMLRSGITTARDLGGGAWQELTLRDRILADESAGPRLLCAGQPVTTPQGHCHFWGGGAEGPEEVAAVIARQIDHNVDWIKVMATGGVFTKGTGVAKVQFDEVALAAMVRQAGAAQRKVAAHCHGTSGIGHAARAGIHTIEHCSFAGKEGFGSDLQQDTVKQIAAAGCWVSPTVNAGWGRRILHEGEPSAFFQRMSRAFEALRTANIPFIASTDAGIPGVFHHQLAAGLAAFSRYARMSPHETLQSATKSSALALGLDDECGALAPGLSADLVVLADDPLGDLATLAAPVLVVARGDVYEPMPPPATPN
jgi:imidazolonepropionase-like amidohydrolase